MTAVNCKHVIRTANSKIKHANLTLRKFTATNCKQPVQISNTTNGVVEDLTITNRPQADTARSALTTATESDSATSESEDSRRVSNPSWRRTAPT